MTGNINIVYATNNKYREHLSISVLSLLRNTQKRNISIYILYTDLEENFQKNFAAFFGQFKVNIYFVEVSDICKKNWGFPVNNRISIEAYYRIFIDRIVEPGEKRALYLDCDTIINAPIEELYFKDIVNNIIGAVEDYLRFDPMFPQFISRLNLHRNNYFNSGVMLIDLNRWRDKEIEKKLIEFISKHNDLLIYHDQDALNSILNLDWFELDYNWNVQTAYINNFKRYSDSFHKPKIIHYTMEKPTEKNCIHPLKEFYEIYQIYLLKKNLL